MGELLNKIRTPADLKALPIEKLEILAEELRTEIIDVVSRRGGHLASNLGTAELTIAMHYVFDFSHDRLLWDVGHQCYAHKLLTSRKERFNLLRVAGGLSGFPDPDESPYDLFKVGHAGTAISTAVGMALADTKLARNNKVVAVVGDASIVNGLSLEGMNNAALLERQFLVVLNDNSMAIDVTQGAMARVLDRVRLTKTYTDLKHAADTLLRRMPLGTGLGEAMRKMRTGLQSALHGQQAFEALGFRYFGPVDGHSVRDLIHMLQKVSSENHPVLLHVHTQKGRGFEYAVEDPTMFHSPSSWTVEEGKLIFSGASRRKWTCAFSDALCALAARDKRVCAITAAMPDGTGLTQFREKFPDRYFDVGISESHAVAMAGGLAKAGLRPVVAVYSTFMQRAFDQVFQEAALQNLPVVVCMDRAGLVGSDGAVHHGFLDIAFLRGLPGMTLMAPADEAELSAAMEYAMTLESPSAIRYPRENLPEPLPEPCPPFESGRSRVLSRGTDGTFFAYGAMVPETTQAAKLLAQRKLSVGVVNARFAKPLDSAMVHSLLMGGKAVIVCEDHAKAGGLGSAVLELAAENGWPTHNLRLAGMPDQFISHASRAEQMVQAGLDPNSLATAMGDLIETVSTAKPSLPANPLSAKSGLEHVG